MKTFTFISLLLLGVACNNIELSPNQTFDRDSPRNLNSHNLKKLQASTVDDTVTIAFVGDSQRFYDDVEKFVNKVNSIPSVDLVLLAGDISDFGLLTEFEWVNKSLSNLKRPYFGVVGNHDVIANGENVFKRMFGPLDFSFVYDSIKFILHNTNGREYPKIPIPDMEWLENELMGETSEEVKYFVLVSHVPPTDNDFNQSLVEPYAQLLRSKEELLVSLHGHIHNHTDGYPFHDGVRYITSFSFKQSAFLIIKITKGTIIKEIIYY